MKRTVGGARRFGAGAAGPAVAAAAAVAVAILARAGAPPARADSVWSALPADRSAAWLGDWAVPSAPDERDVVLIGHGSADAPPAAPVSPAARAVRRFALPEADGKPRDSAGKGGPAGAGAGVEMAAGAGAGTDTGVRARKSGPPSQVAWAEPEIPRDALWPDAQGRFAAPAASPVGAGVAPPPRNPGEVRVAAKNAGGEMEIRCGGIIVGGGGGAVALVNGKGVRRGDRVGPFTVAAVRRGEVVVERNGTFYVVPEGRSVLIWTAAA